MMHKNSIQVLLFALAFCFTSLTTSAQLGVAFYQSDLQFIGINYELKDRYRVELSIGVDQNVINIPLMLDVNYDIIQKKHYEFYAGVGLIVFGGFDNEPEGNLTIPLGVNIYPFEKQRIGFHIEALPIFIDEDSLLLGSWGIRYQFAKDK